MSENKHTQGQCKVVIENKPFLEIDTPGAIVTIAEVYNNTDYVDRCTGAFNAERLALCWNSHDTLLKQRDDLKTEFEVIKAYEEDCRHRGIGYDSYVADIVKTAIEQAEKGK